MIVAIALAGLFVLLFVPKLGHVLGHLILHGIVHLADHHGDWVPLTYSAVLTAAVVAFPVFLLLHLWFAALDVALFLLVLTKLFGTFGGRH